MSAGGRIAGAAAALRARARGRGSAIGRCVCGELIYENERTARAGGRLVHDRCATFRGQMQVK